MNPNGKIFLKKVRHPTLSFEISRYVYPSEIPILVSI
jgi:hypothetical protein